MAASVQGAWIAAIGMMTPVGDCAAQTSTSVRAGINRYQESAVYNKRFEPMTLALMPEDSLPPLNDEIAALSGLTSRLTRMLRLAGPAMKEAMDAYPGDQPIPLFLATPEPLPDMSSPVNGSFFNYLEKQTGIMIDRSESRGVPTGRAGGIQAIQLALECLDKGQHDYALIGGIDTYLDLYLLGTLDSDNRVLANGIMDGFCPGEGAGFILICSDKAKASHQPAPSTWLHPPGIATESGHRYSDQPYRGDGLAEAASLALNHLNGSKTRTLYMSLNGENFGAKEMGVAITRNNGSLDANHRIEHPADCFGDIGAAFGPVLIGLAAMDMVKESQAQPALICCSSEQARRGAVCIEPR